MSAQAISRHFKALLDSVHERRDSMQRMLIDWSETNSGTGNLEGIALMQDKIESVIQQLDAKKNIIPSTPVSYISDHGEILTRKVGDVLSFTKRESAPYQILLSGHLDTVFDKEHPFQKVSAIDDNCLNGPGVADMKGGLLVMLEALALFEQTEIKESIGWQVVINADEEIGSPGSAPFLDKACQGKHLALVYEPSMTEEGLFAGSRKGSGKFSLVAKGRSAHAGRDFDKGLNAICYLAEVIHEIDLLNGQRDGVTINVGYIKGGGALNSVPDIAICKLDVRILDGNQAKWVHQSLANIIHRFQKKEGYQLILHGDFSRPSKPLTPATLNLFNALKECGEVFNLEIGWAPSGGCCDGNNYAHHGLAVVDTLGVRGGNIHQSQEFVLLDSLVERAQLSSLLLMLLASGKIKDFANGNAISTHQS